MNGSNDCEQRKIHNFRVHNHFPNTSVLFLKTLQKTTVPVSDEIQQNTNVVTKEDLLTRKRYERIALKYGSNSKTSIEHE